MTDGPPPAWELEQEARAITAQPGSRCPRTRGAPTSRGLMMITASCFGGEGRIRTYDAACTAWRS
jgi:hypothetical protein